MQRKETVIEGRTLSRRWSATAACVLLIAFCNASALAAQELRSGEISGMVVDTEGRPLAAQRLELTGPATQQGLRLVVTTDSDGVFAFRRLPAGTYSIDWVVSGEVVLSRGPLQLTQTSMHMDRVVLVQPAVEVPLPERVNEHTQAITFNPLFGLNGFYNGEYERRLSRKTTWGASVTGSRWDENKYRSVKALVRFYTRGIALQGNFLGLRAGRSWATDGTGTSDPYFVLGAELGRTVGVTGEGVELVASGGAGVNRLIGADDFDGLKWFPALRFNLGVAF